MSEPALFERDHVNDDIETETGVVPEVRWKRLAEHLHGVLRPDRHSEAGATGAVAEAPALRTAVPPNA